MTVAIDDVVGGEGVPSQRLYTTPNTNFNNQHGPVHVNPYPNTDSPGQTPECAAGNEPFPATNAVIGNPPGNVGLADREDHEAEAVKRRRRYRISNLSAGLIAIAVIGIACYYVFGGSWPFTGKQFVLKAMFTIPDAAAHPVAGADRRRRRRPSRVGAARLRLVQTRPWSRWTSTRTACRSTPMRTPRSARACSSRATSTSTCSRGTPNAPLLSSGDTLPAGQNAGPVQLDRVLAALTTPARTNLQTLLQGFGASLDTRGTAAANATQDPSVRGLTGGQALNESLNYSVGAFRASAIVNEGAARPAAPRPVRRRAGQRAGAEGLRAAAGSALSSLVHTFNATMATLASRQQDLSQTISLLPPLLRRTEAADTALDKSFGPTQRFAATFLPSVKQIDPTIGAALPWIAQAKALVSKAELGGLLSDLTPAVQNTASSLNSTKALVSSAEVLGAVLLDHNTICDWRRGHPGPPSSTGCRSTRELFQERRRSFRRVQELRRRSTLPAGLGGGGRSGADATLPNIGPLYGSAVLHRGSRPAFTVQLPAAGCTTSPAGLSITMSSSSSNTTLSGMVSPLISLSSAGGSATLRRRRR